jgi:hypothetical protein
MVLALLLSATSATLAKDRTFYDSSSNPVQSGNSYNPTTSGYDPTEASQR